MENYSSLFLELQAFMPKFISGLVTFIPFCIAWLISKSIFRKIIASLKGPSKHSAIIYLGKSISVIIWIIAILTVLGTWGIDISALVAGLGLTGFAVGYALKDVLVNTIAGIMIIFYKTIEINSHIALLDVEGTVIDIDLRYITIQGAKSKHLIPNSLLLSEKITIFDE
jgi:small conductance mechanosensitive channel